MTAATYSPVLYSSDDEQHAAADGLPVSVSVGKAHEPSTFSGPAAALVEVMRRLHGNLEEAFPDDMDAAALGAWYAEVVGYNPFDELDGMALEKVREMARDWQRANEAAHDPRQGGRG